MSTEGDETATTMSTSQTGDGSTTETGTGTATSTADHTQDKTEKDDDDSLSSITESSDEGTSDTGLTENQPVVINVEDCFSLFCCC